jgi:hypothetical protein
LNRRATSAGALVCGADRSVTAGHACSRACNHQKIYTSYTRTRAHPNLTTRTWANAEKRHDRKCGLRSKQHVRPGQRDRWRLEEVRRCACTDHLRYLRAAGQRRVHAAGPTARAIQNGLHLVLARHGRGTLKLSPGRTTKTLCKLRHASFGTRESGGQREEANKRGHESEASHRPKTTDQLGGILCKLRC